VSSIEPSRIRTQPIDSGTYAPDPSDTEGTDSQLIGIAWVTFDSTTGALGSATPRIFVGVANMGSTNIFVTNDAGATCS
jgi:xyloglucan-specific exo-beta-1,4-glucanase